MNGSLCNSSVKSTTFTQPSDQISESSASAEAAFARLPGEVYLAEGGGAHEDGLVRRGGFRSTELF